MSDLEHVLWPVIRSSWGWRVSCSCGWRTRVFAYPGYAQSAAGNHARDAA